MTDARRPPRRDPRRRQRLDARREIVLDYLTDGPAKGWLHTHGLAAHGHPELEIRNVPAFLRIAAAGLLNDVAEYLLNDARVALLAGDLLHVGSSSIQVLAARPDAQAGYDPSHYEGCVRLVMVDAPATGCECGECGECARELAARSTLRN